MHLCLGTTPAMQRTMIFQELKIDEVNRAAEVRLGASGKSINVARVLTVLGEKALACGFVGGDTGKLIRADLDAAGIQHDFVETGVPTRTCVTLIDRAGGSVTELVEEAGEVLPEHAAALTGKFKALLAGKTMLILSGSLAAGVGEDFYAECCREANAAGVPVLLDARGAALREAMKYRPLVVKHNRGELAETMGLSIKTEDDLRKAIVTLLHDGPAWAVITLGAEGAVVSDGKVFFRIPALKIDVVSPIGSGDAFAAGLAAGIARGKSVPDACRLGAACAAANAMIAGSGQVRLENVVRLEPEVRVIPM